MDSPEETREFMEYVKSLKYAVDHNREGNYEIFGVDISFERYNLSHQGTCTPNGELTVRIRAGNLIDTVERFMRGERATKEDQEGEQ